MARFVEIFKDWIVSYPNRYKIIEDGQEKTVEIERDWEPDVNGTSNDELRMNELVKNTTYDTNTTHTAESGTSVYICDLVGMKEFIEYSSSDSSFIPKISAQINTANSNQLSKIRFSGKDGSTIDYDLYTINNGIYSLLGANKLKPNTIVVIKIVSNGANKIAVIQYLIDNKLDKGTYTGDAGTLKTEIDGKVNRAGDTMLAMLNFQGENIGISFLKQDKTYVGSIYGTETGNVYIKNLLSNKNIVLYNDGTATYPAENLNTTSKEVISGLNEVNNLVQTKAGKFVYNKTSSYPDMNNLKEPGIYFLNNDVLCPNSPDPNRAMMIVSNTDYPMQLWFPYFKRGVFYIRNWTGSSWSGWEKSSSLEGTRNKYIIKDMTINFNGSGTQTFYFNNAFPNACLGVIATDIQNVSANPEMVQFFSTTRTSFQGIAIKLPDISDVALECKIIALGY